MTYDIARKNFLAVHNPSVEGGQGSVKHRFHPIPLEGDPDIVMYIRRSDPDLWPDRKRDAGHQEDRG